MAMLDYSESGMTSLSLNVGTDGRVFFRHTCSCCGLAFEIFLDAYMPDWRERKEILREVQP